MRSHQKGMIALEERVASLTAVLKELKKSIDQLSQRLCLIEKQTYFWKGGLTVLLLTGAALGSLGHLLVNVFK